MTIRKLLITTALPYANGATHLGHLVEQIQADIWVRFQKMRGLHCIFICGDDAHGTPIMISAEKQGITPEQLIADVHRERLKVFKSFFIDFDTYHTTHSVENQEMAALVYQRLFDKGDIETRSIQQAFDPEKNMFLPDRYVKGECPRCGAGDQYGDNCEACGATYAPTELKNPLSVLSGATPIQKESVHYFFLLEHYTEALQNWIHAGHLQEQVANKLSEWFAEGLQAWDISRDAPYFGFEIPGAPGKYFYVWVDAPVGYMASFKHHCAAHPTVQFDEYWGQESTTELYHFIGKDIVYFHALFWPAMLEGSGFRKPTAIFTHGFLTVNGQKMSKSRNTFITAEEYLAHFNPECLRYYFAAKLNSRIEDIDLNFTDFTQRINADLVGKVVNIASRCAGFITKLFAGKLAAELEQPGLQKVFVDAGVNIADLYEKREYQQAVREIMALADRANQYIDLLKPWVLAKDPAEKNRLHAVCTQALNLFRLLIIYLKPILPKTAENVEAFLQIPPLFWSDLDKPLLDHTIASFTPLLQRVEAAGVEALFASKEAARAG